MFLLYFLDTYINLVKYLQNVTSDDPLTGAICIKMQEKLIQKYQILGHTGSIQKQPSAGI